MTRRLMRTETGTTSSVAYATSKVTALITAYLLAAAVNIGCTTDPIKGSKWIGPDFTIIPEAQFAELVLKRVYALSDARAVHSLQCMAASRPLEIYGAPSGFEKVFNLMIVNIDGSAGECPTISSSSRRIFSLTDENPSAVEEAVTFVPRAFAGTMLGMTCIISLSAFCPYPNISNALSVKVRLERESNAEPIVIQRIARANSYALNRWTKAEADTRAFVDALAEAIAGVAADYATMFNVQPKQ